MPGFYKKSADAPNLSFSMDTFWSTDEFALGNGTFQSVKIGVYGSRINFNFAKGTTNSGGGGKGHANTAYVSMDYESACVVANTLIYIRNERKKAYLTGAEYPTWSFRNTLQFTDKETKALRTIGVFEIRTEISPATQKSTVYVIYTQGPDEYKVALGSMFIKDQCEFTSQTDFDPSDSRFYAFCDMFIQTVMNYPSMMLQLRTFDITMQNFSAIRAKMGIPSNNNRRQNNDGGDDRYTDKSYSTEPKGITNGSSEQYPQETGNYSQDMPY